MGKVKFYLTPAEVELLKEFKLATPAEVIDFYQHTKNSRLEALYLKTIGALYQIA